MSLTIHSFLPSRDLTSTWCLRKTVHIEVYSTLLLMSRPGYGRDEGSFRGWERRCALGHWKGPRFDVLLAIDSAAAVSL